MFLAKNSEPDQVLNAAADTGREWDGMPFILDGRQETQDGRALRGVGQFCPAVFTPTNLCPDLAIPNSVCEQLRQRTDPPYSGVCDLNNRVPG